jgi:hypothetical protein
VNKALLVASALLLAACAAQEETSSKDKEQAIRDYIVVAGLAEQEKMRNSSDDRWSELEPSFIIYKTRRGAFLVEFSRPCYELAENIVVADERWDRHTIRARFDTIRGCRIDRIFALTEGDVAELENIGESPGSRN